MPSLFDNSESPASGTRDGNAPLSVSEITRRIKDLLESRFGFVRVRGEISGLRIQSSGHAYFTLKDASAQLPAVVWARVRRQLKIQLKDGLQIVAEGRIEVYEPHGKYQFSIQSAREEGLGQLQEAFEKLKRKLAAEGIFDESLKRELPTFPQKIAFVTSPTGAAIRDFISILKRNAWRGRLFVVPARVQGEGAAEQIVRGIGLANSLRELDLLVVGRGGGSLEDLWCFNEEIVARAVRASRVPVISAVGHQIDFTLSDFAADKRAETPSAAAELISFACAEIASRFESAAESLEELTERALRERAQSVDLLESKLARHSPQNRLALARERVAGTARRLENALTIALARSREQVAHANFALEKLSPTHRVRLAKLHLEQLASRLAASGIDSTLRRGFAVARDAGTGKILDSARKIGFGQLVELQFSDGKTRVEGRDLN